VTNLSTYKGMSFVLGLGLAALWVAGLNSPIAPRWFTWFDGLAAAGAFIVAAMMQSYDTRAKRVGGPITLAIGLLVLWIIGLATGAVGWMSWWTFAFACGFLTLAVAAGGPAPVTGETEIRTTRPEELPFDEPGEDRFRKAG
jgi:hypothetical protein